MIGQKKSDHGLTAAVTQSNKSKSLCCGHCTTAAEVQTNERNQAMKRIIATTAEGQAMIQTLGGIARQLERIADALEPVTPNTNLTDAVVGLADAVMIERMIKE